MHGTKRHSRKMSVEKHYGTHRYRWEDNIKMDLKERDYEVDATRLSQNRDRWRALVRAVIHCIVAP